jgi:ribosome-binding protein aMBF1 (putative translation factor)
MMTCPACADNSTTAQQHNSTTAQQHNSTTAQQHKSNETQYKKNEKIYIFHFIINTTHNT